jgi:hypothetical protein
MYGISKAGKYRTRAAKRLQIQHPNESCMSKRALSDESDQSDTGDSFNQPDSDRKQKRLQKKHKKQQLNNVLAGRGTRADFIDGAFHLNFFAFFILCNGFISVSPQCMVVMLEWNCSTSSTRFPRKINACQPGIFNRWFCGASPTPPCSRVGALSNANL